MKIQVEGSKIPGRIFSLFLQIVQFINVQIQRGIDETISTYVLIDNVEGRKKDMRSHQLISNTTEEYELILVGIDVVHIFFI